MVKRLLMTMFLIGAAAGSSLAQPGPAMFPGNDGCCERGPRMGREAMAEKMNLTEKQKEDMQKFRLDLQKKQTAVQAKIRLAQLDIRELSLSDNPDKNAIIKKMKEVSDLEYQKKVNHVEHLFTVRTILTPEQQKMWKSHLLDRGMGMRGERMQKRMEGTMDGRMEGRMEKRIERRIVR